VSYLLYGIVKDPPAITSNLTGVQVKPVIFVEAHGLCAAVSELDVEEGTPPVAELLSYAQVVETLHRRQAVVPMRYGCFLNGIPAIRDVLTAGLRQYETLLAEIDGHVEMAIQIILPEKKCEKISSEGITLPNEKSAISGRDYLALRKIHYHMQEEMSQDCQAFVDRYIRSFSGLYVRHRTERNMNNGAVILSLYFLTPENAVNRFRDIFGDMMAAVNDEALLSGPWPPYNFVTTEKCK
jgi:hypothetical protein